MFNLNFQLFNGAINNPTILNWPLLTTLIPAKATDKSYTFTRASSSWSVDHEGVLRKALADQARFSGARVVRNLAIGLTTQSVVVEVGKSYQVVIKGGTGDTCVCTGSFTGTLTANGTDRISWNSGTPKVATTTSITLTVIGTLTELSVEDVTNQTIQTPGEHLDSTTSYGQGIDGVKSFDTTNANTVDANGVVTEIPGVPITGIKGFLYEPQRTNKCENYNVIGVDLYGSDIVAGTTLKGIRYEIVAQSLLDFTTIGSADSLVGTSFTSSGILTLTAEDSLKEIGAADVNTGLFVSGLGTGAQAYHDGTSFQNPIPGMTLTGDVAAVLSIVDDSVELEAAGLLNISPRGKVYKLDNSLGSVNATTTFTGQGVNLTNHMSHVMSRSGGASTVGVGISNVTGSTPVAGITYANAEFGGVLVNATDESNIVAAGGEVLYFLLNQLEEGSAVTSQIITQGTSATRAKDDLQLPVADGVNFSQKEGMLFCDWVPGFDKLPFGFSSGIVSTRNVSASVLYNGNIGQFVSFDSISVSQEVTTTYTQGSLVKLFSLWGSSLIVGASGVSGNTAPYDGSFTLGTSYHIGYSAPESFNISNVKVLKKDRGQVYAETLTYPDNYGYFKTSSTSPNPLAFTVYGSDVDVSWGDGVSETVTGIFGHTYSPVVVGSPIKMDLSNAAGLTHLYCSNNQLTGNVPDLSNNVNLVNFYCHYNQLTGNVPDLSNNVNLVNFYCSNNQLTGNVPDLSNNVNLVNFYCSTNQLTGNIPDLSNNVNLVNFYCSNNQLTGNVPDLSNNVNLTNFSCYNNQLTGNVPDLSNNVNLVNFYCHYNQLTGNIPDLSSNVNLVNFSCYNNQLTGISQTFAVPPVGFTFKAYTNLLPVDAIDAILAAFVFAASPTPGTINISGTGNAAPSVQGLADKATLIGWGWTVTTNV